MKRSLLPVVIAVALSSTLALAQIPELGLATTPAAVRPVALEGAPGDARRLPFAKEARALVADLDAYTAATPTYRLHASTDRPLYRPGDAVQVKGWMLATRELAPSSEGLTLQLVDPRGTALESQWVDAEKGSVDHTFHLDEKVPGGSWSVQLVAPDGSMVARAFSVASFEAPRVKKTLEFARDGYEPGDEVSAAITLERSTGEKLANVTATARVQADGVALAPMEIRTDARGEATVAFSLPDALQSPDVILTVSVDDGGVVESISRPVPVVLDDVHLAFFPEGGELVAGLPSRVYFEATDARGEPADVTGKVVDDRGRVIAAIESWVDGRGHLSFTPQEGRTYRAVVDRASGQVEVDLPRSRDDGCVLHHHDDLEGVQQAVRVSVTCTDDRDVVVLASQQEQLVDRAAVHVARGAPTTVYLRSAFRGLSGAQGVARVTLMDEELQPLAERLVYRNRERSLQVEITPNRERYAPGDEVSLTVRTTDPDGVPVPAELSLSVVDDALLAFADDDEHTLMSGVLLQADLPDPIEGAADWFDPASEDGGLALDLALGTRGWRRFDWTPVAGFRAAQEEQRRYELEAAQVVALGYAGGGWGGGGWGRGGGVEMDMPMAEGGDGWGGPVPMAPPPPMARPAAVARSGPAKDDDRGDELKKAAEPVRRFAAAAPGAADLSVSPRTDFRDTVYWGPTVRTGASGVTRVKFALSDAVTGFRATAEGLGDSWLGRGEALLTSSLPFHLDARLPVELSAGDVVFVPVTLENQQPGSVKVDLRTEVSPLLVLGDEPADLVLAAGERKTVYVPLTAKEDVGTADVHLTARAGTATDSVIRQIPVAPRGFPVTFTQSGVIDGQVTHLVDVPTSLPGSLSGRVVIYPTAVSELLEGIEGMVQTPGGCFEQTSSTNYPNVMVLDWLQRSGTMGRLAVDREQVLSAGYQILAGYQVGSGGFETWGDGPGKEALSAYGLLQFTDMAKVFDVDPDLLEENAAYLRSVRDGNGGYSVTGSSSHGYGTAPPEVLDAYITYALVETGHAQGLDRELAAQVAMARTSTDAYRLSLATLSLLSARPSDGRVAAARLAKLQDPDGSFPGSETSITRSENQNLLVEATALSSMALLRAGNFGAAKRAVEWIHASQTGSGTWGATQGNALALKAIAEMAEATAAMDAPGHVEVLVDGELVAEARFEAGSHEPLSLPIGPWLHRGPQQVELVVDGASVPYTLEVGWATVVPQSAEDRRVDLTTTLADATLAQGDTTRLLAKLTNRTGEVVPDPIARIGLPAGLVPQTWQLEQLKEQGLVAFFETRPREVTLYWDGIAAGEVHEVALDLVAEVPGRFTGPSSSAYPYYDDEARAWVEGLRVSIEPASTR